MTTRTYNINVIFRFLTYSILSLVIFSLISCNRTDTSNQTPSPNNPTQTNNPLETTNTGDINEWLVPLLSEYLQDDNNTPVNPSLTVYKNGNGSGNVTSSPNGINCGSTCNSNFNANTTVTLTAVADTGSIFTGWSGCSATSGNTCTVTINSLQSVTATFTSTLTYQGFYITQAAQNFNNSAAIVESRESFARLFLTQTGTDHTALDVDLHVYSGSTNLGTIDLTGPNIAPMTYSEGDLSTSYNAYVPAAWIQTDTNYYLTFSSALGTDIIRYPATGTMNQNVKAAPTFEVIWVPIVYNGQTPSMSASDREILLKSTREYLPIVDINQTVRASYTFNGQLEGPNAGNGWVDLVSEINMLRITDGAASNVYYHAIVDNAAFASGSGIYGIAYRPGKAAVSRESTDTVAHEWGHNFGRQHVLGCGNPNSPDNNYPYSFGSIGVWGINVHDNSLSLKNPSIWEDTMSYCNDEWISDYNYDAIANYRALNPDIVDDRIKQQVLVISGTIFPNSSVSINKAFPIEALADLPNFGSYKIQLVSSNTTTLAEINFAPLEIDHSDQKHFLVSIPISNSQLSDLTLIRIIDSSNTVVAERNFIDLQSQ